MLPMALPTLPSNLRLSCDASGACTERHTVTLVQESKIKETAWGTVQGLTCHASCSGKLSAAGLHSCYGCVTGHVQVSKPNALLRPFGRSRRSTMVWHG